MGYTNMEMQGAACLALQEEKQNVLHPSFEDYILCVIHAHHIMIKPKDIELARHLKRRDHHDNQQGPSLPGPQKILCPIKTNILLSFFLILSGPSIPPKGNILPKALHQSTYINYTRATTYN